MLGSPRSIPALALFALLPLQLAGSAVAQPLTLNPDGTDNVEPPPEEEETPIIVNVPGQGQAEGQKQGEGQKGADGGEGDTGFYYTEGVDGRPGTYGGGVRGPVPEVHVVQGGDTLWDICGFYFNNPWEWPRIWSYNPSITNPHWIYPGDLVRLYEGSAGPIASAPEPTKPGAEPTEPEPVGTTTGPAGARQRGFSLRRLAFVGTEELKDAMIIDGAVEERMLLSQGDDVYLRYAEGNRPRPGEKHTVYSEVEKVVHPETGVVLGSFVRTRGDVEVRSVKKDRRARAHVTRSTDVIERGQKVGPIRKRFDTVEARRNEASLQGVIAGVIGGRELIGARQLVLVDLGKNSGLKEGNRLYVVRRGDARLPFGQEQQAGQDDRRFPARAIGEVIVVDVGEQISLALVTLAMQELGVGDHVLMRPDDQ